MSCADKDLQAEEVDVLSSIYGDSWTVVDAEAGVYCMRLTDSNEPPHLTLSFKVILLENYPSECPPLFELGAPWLTNVTQVSLSTSLQGIYEESPGEIVLFRWIEFLREFLSSSPAEDESGGEPEESNDVACAAAAAVSEDLTEEVLPVAALSLENQTATPSKFQHKDLEPAKCPEIHHGEPVTDRKSTFQSHLAMATSIDEVQRVRVELLSNRKIAAATHNILAYRLFDESRGLWVQDCDDDGETAAGSRMLHLMQILDVKNVVVVVTRWYGGIHLGPDRFKHINNCTRSILVACGMVTDKDTAKSSRGKKSKSTKK